MSIIKQVLWNIWTNTYGHIFAPSLRLYMQDILNILAVVQKRKEHGYLMFVKQDKQTLRLRLSTEICNWEQF